MAIQKPLPIEKMVFRKTNSHLGRSLLRDTLKQYDRSFVLRPNSPGSQLRYPLDPRKV